MDWILLDQESPCTTFAHIHCQRESEGKEGGRENRGRDDRVFQRIDDNEFHGKALESTRLFFDTIDTISVACLFFPT